jgi:hypothetical protein
VNVINGLRKLLGLPRKSPCLRCQHMRTTLPERPPRPTCIEKHRGFICGKADYAWNYRAWMATDSGQCGEFEEAT